MSRFGHSLGNCEEFCNCTRHVFMLCLEHPWNVSSVVLFPSESVGTAGVAAGKAPVKWCRFVRLHWMLPTERPGSVKSDYHLWQCRGPV